LGKQQLAFVLDYLKKVTEMPESEITISDSEGFSVDVRNGDVDVLEHHRDKSVDVTVYIDGAQGSASTSDLSEAALQQTVQAAVNIAKHTQADPCNGLAEKDELAFDYPDCELNHPWGITPEQAIEEAKACEAAAFAYDKRICNSDGVHLSTHSANHIYANSHGFVGEYSSTKHFLNCSMIAKDANGMQRESAYTISRDADTLQSFKQIGEQAAKRTLSRLGAKAINTQQSPVLFTPEVARGLLGHFVGAIRGGSLYRKSSFLLDKLGESVFPDWVNVQEHPHIINALGSAPFDSDCVKTWDKDFVEAGVLKSYALGCYSARQLGMKTTGNANGVHNLSIGHTGQSFDDLLKQLHTGLLVTDVMGQGVNTTTGNYSRGASGFWVENGEIQFPVQEITIASNLADMYKGLMAVGSDTDTRGNLRTGSWLIDNMMIAGT
tara:strand:- start:36537 stop:37847 length:1311 start_codon:yes stop_codon:yes gene_type:complete